jgi:alpha-mannosidase II
LIDAAKNHELEDDKLLPAIEFERTKTTHYLVVHNSMPHDRTDMVEVIISSHLVIVTNAEDEPVPCQVMPIFRWHDDANSDNKIPKLVENRYRLVFREKVRPLGLAVYKIQAKNSILDCK